MLQKQTPASKIPRFNPHGYQPPPQEKKKEVEVQRKTFTSSSKKSGNQAQKDEKEDITVWSKFNIEDLLDEMVSYNLILLPIFKFKNFLIKHS